MSDGTGSRPRRSSAGQPPAWFKPQDPPLPADRRPEPRAARPPVPDTVWAPRPSGPPPQQWPSRSGAQPPPAAHSTGHPGPHAAQASPHSGPPPRDPALRVVAYTTGSRPRIGAPESLRQQAPWPPEAYAGHDPATGHDHTGGHSGPRQWWARVFGGEEEGDEGLLDDWEVMLQAIDTTVDQRRITVASLGPGAGRTTTTLGLGTALALHRRDPVVSLDLDPRGRLAERVGAEHALTARDLLGSLARLHTASDLRRFTSIARSRLEVLAAAPGVALTGDDLAAVMQVLSTFRPVTLADTAADPTLPATAELMRATDALVVPTTTAEGRLRIALETLAWWEQRGAAGLVPGAVVPVVRAGFVPPDPSRPPRGRELRRMVDEHEAACDAREDEIMAVLGPRVRAVVPVPHDPALEAGGLFVWDDLDPETQDAYINLAYEVARGFAG